MSIGNEGEGNRPPRPENGARLPESESERQEKLMETIFELVEATVKEIALMKRLTRNWKIPDELIGPIQSRLYRLLDDWREFSMAVGGVPQDAYVEYVRKATGIDEWDEDDADNEDT